MPGTGRLIRAAASGCEPFEPRVERLGGPIFTVVGLAVLVVCTALAAFSEPGPQWTVTLAIAGGTALWLPLLIPVFPRRIGKPWLAVMYYAVVLAAALVLVSRNEIFTGFVSVGYPLAFALFPARWSVFPVAVTAIAPLLIKGGWGTDTHTPMWIVILSVAGPLLYAAWFVGAESEKRRRANAQLASANARLETALEENAGLHAQLLAQAREAGKLDERQRMAREIHDTLAQGLTGIVTQLQAAERADGTERRRHLANVHTLAKTSLTEARRAVDALRPESLAEAQLPEALAELVRRFAETSGAEARAETTGNVRPLLPELEVTLYRVAQEALANAEKHSRASRVGLTLSYSDDLVLLDIRDDGVGFTPGDLGRGNGNGFGLEAMRQRVRRVAGTLEIESNPGEGTAISAQIPAIGAETA
jgi:signal transduction histidine kinase